jgi:hypothetical protein
VCLLLCYLQEKPAPVETKPKKTKEPTSFSLTNPSRLIPTQTRFVSLQEGQRYVPICRRNHPAGIVMLFDTDPSAPETVEKGALLWCSHGSIYPSLYFAHALRNLL